MSNVPVRREYPSTRRRHRRRTAAAVIGTDDPLAVHSHSRHLIDIDTTPDRIHACPPGETHLGAPSLGTAPTGVEEGTAMRARLLSLVIPVMLLGQCAPDGCAPGPGPAGFEPGTRLVGSEIAPGTYIARNANGCYWARLAGLGGTFDEIITNNFGDGPAIVAVAATDVAFESDRECGRWVLYGPAAMVNTFGDGDWGVGVEISAGRWASDPASTGCYWERASGFGHGFDEIIGNDFGEGRAVVDIAATDIRFSSSGCGNWTRIG